MVLSVSSGLRAGYTALLDINKGIETAQSRLNTGKTINSAMDGAASFLRASSMSRRSAALSELVKGMDLGANSLKAADKGLDAMRKLLESAQSEIKAARDTTTAVIGTGTSVATTGGKGFAVTYDNGTRKAGTALVGALDGTNTASKVALDKTLQTLGVADGTATSKARFVITKQDGTTETLDFNRTDTLRAVQTALDGKGLSLTIGDDGKATVASKTTGQTFRLSITSMEGTTVSPATGNRNGRLGLDGLLNTPASSFAGNTVLGTATTVAANADRSATTKAKLLVDNDANAANNATLDGVTGNLGLTTGTSAVMLYLKGKGGKEVAFDVSIDATTTVNDFIARVQSNSGIRDLGVTLSVGTDGKLAIAGPTDLQIGFGTSAATAKTGSLNDKFGFTAADATTAPAAGTFTVTGGLTGDAALDAVSMIGTGSDSFAAGDSFTVAIKRGDGVTFSATFKAAAPGSFASGSGTAEDPRTFSTMKDLVNGMNTLLSGGKLAVTTTKTTENGVARFGMAMAVGDTTSELSITKGAGNTKNYTQIFGSGGGSTTPDGATTTYTPVRGQASSAADPRRSAAAETLRGALKQIDRLARDSAVNGAGSLLLGQTIKVAVNPEGDDEMVLKGVTADTAGLGFSKTGTDFDGLDFSTNADLDAQLGKIQKALSTIDANKEALAFQSGGFNARQGFANDMIRLLDSSASTLTAANVDEETANLMALQTRQQLSITNLASTKQTEQGLLQLLR